MITVGLAGLGRIGCQYDWGRDDLLISHFKAILDNSNFQLCWVADPSPQNRAQILERLPHELWACDSSAFCLAENFFPEVSVILQPNWYWEKIRGQVTPGCSGHYLIALENRQLRGQTWRDNIDAALHWLSLQKHVLHVTIRAHPTMEQSEIERYLANKGQLPFNANVSHGNLIEDLSSCFSVVGYQTTVLALARVCGKQAVSLVNIDEQLVIPLAGIEQPFK